MCARSEAKTPMRSSLTLTGATTEACQCRCFHCESASRAFRTCESLGKLRSAVAPHACVDEAYRRREMVILLAQYKGELARLRNRMHAIVTSDPGYEFLGSRSFEAADG